MYVYVCIYVSGSASLNFDTFPNSFYDSSINLVPKSDKNIKREKNYRPIFFVNIDINTLNRIKLIEFSCMERIIFHDQFRFISGM